jgi:hypothetical protein
VFRVLNRITVRRRLMVAGAYPPANDALPVRAFTTPAGTLSERRCR